MEFTQSIIDSLRNAVVVLDSSSRIMVANLAFYELFEIAKVDAEGKLIFEIKEDLFDIPALRKLLQVRENEKLSEDLELHISISEKKTRHLVMNVRQIERHLPGLKFTTLLSIEDVTDLALAQSKFNKLLESCPDAMVIINQAYEIVFVNTVAESLFGYQPKELLGKQLSILVPERHRSQYLSKKGAFEKIPRHTIGSDLQLSAVCKDGREFPVEICLSPIETDEGVLMSSTIRDLTERKKAHNSLKLHAAIVQNMSEGVALVRPGDLTILYTNNTLDRMFGYEKGELSEKPASILHGKNDKILLEGVQKSLRENGFWSGESYAYKKDGGRLWCLTNVSVLQQTEAISEVIWVSVYSDISQRKIAEENLLELASKLQRSNSELEQFAYVASHDLQEPLRKVTNYVDLLRENTKGILNEKTEKYMNYITDGTKRMRTLIDDLLTFSTVGHQRGGFEYIDLKSLVDEVLNDFSQTIAKAGAEVSVGNLPVVRANRTGMSQLFSNLISNALKFANSKPLSIAIGASSTQEEHHIWIADNGIGIEREYKDQIFGLFRRLHSTRQYSGTGIGLSICKKVAENHGGKIWVESTFGEGSTFHVSLPVYFVREKSETQDI